MGYGHPFHRGNPSICLPIEGFSGARGETNDFDRDKQ